MDPSVEMSRTMKDIASSLRDIAKGMHALNDQLVELNAKLNQEGDA